MDWKATKWRTVAELTVLVKPVAKGRPKATSAGGFVSMYTPKTTRDYEKKIRTEYECSGNGLCKGPLWISVHCIFSPNKSETKKAREGMIAGRIHHQKKPDLDNCVKSVLDALNGTAYEDDSDIVRISATKSYGETDNVKIVIRELED